MHDEFWKWWSSGGSKKWAAALDAEGGTLKALEMVFNAGRKAKKSADFKEFTNLIDEQRPERKLFEETPIDKLKVSTYIINALKNSGIKTIQQLEDNLPRLPKMANIGKVALSEILAALRSK